MGVGEVIAAVGSIGVAIVAAINVYLLVRDREMNKNTKLSSTLANLLIVADRLTREAEKQFKASDEEITARVTAQLTEVAKGGRASQDL